MTSATFHFFASIDFFIVPSGLSDGGHFWSAFALQALGIRWEFYIGFFLRGNLKMRVVHNFHFVLLCARNINELAYRTGCPHSLSFFCRRCKSMYFLSGMKSEKVRLNKQGVGEGKCICFFFY